MGVENSMATVPNHSTSASEPQPAWDVALLFPSQGQWTEFEYLALDTNRLVELIDGNLEVLPMPTIRHQQIVVFLLEILKSFVTRRQLGTVLVAPLPVRIRDKTYREPDVIFFTKEQVIQPDGNYLQGANLVIEVVSADEESHKRDYQQKRSDYAELGILEYWIVDPQTERITVLTLEGQKYHVHGEFAPGGQATSVLLSGFAVDVSAVFEAGREVL
jgi:Uma2 family endonuclease